MSALFLSAIVLVGLRIWVPISKMWSFIKPFRSSAHSHGKLLIRAKQTFFDLLFCLEKLLERCMDLSSIPREWCHRHKSNKLEQSAFLLRVTTPGQSKIEFDGFKQLIHIRETGFQFFSGMQLKKKIQRFPVFSRSRHTASSVSREPID